MTYDVTLIEAEIPEQLKGHIRLGLDHGGKQVAELDYQWDARQFTAVFHGNAPSLPVPAHPISLLQKPIEAMQAVRTNAHLLPTDVFRDHRITITLD